MAQKLFNAQTICIFCYLIIDHAIHFILSSCACKHKIRHILSANPIYNK